MLLMMARRGSLIFASRTIRRFISHFYTAVTEPWGWTHGTDGIPANNFVTNAGSFTWDETNGGVGLDESRYDIAASSGLHPAKSNSASHLEMTVADRPAPRGRGRREAPLPERSADRLCLPDGDGELQPAGQSTAHHRQVGGL